MRLEPEAVDVLGELDAEIGALEIGAEHLLDVARHPLVLEGLGDRLADREACSRFSTSKYLRVLLCSSRLPETPSSEGASKGSVITSSTLSAGKQRLQRPVAIGLLGPLRRYRRFSGMS